MRLFEELMNLEGKDYLILGQARLGIKTIIFNEKDFKEELKPENAVIKRDIINSEKKIFMSYLG